MSTLSFSREARSKGVIVGSHVEQLIITIAIVIIPQVKRLAIKELWIGCECEDAILIYEKLLARSYIPGI